MGSCKSFLWIFPVSRQFSGDCKFHPIWTYTHSFHPHSSIVHNLKRYIYLTVGIHRPVIYGCFRIGGSCNYCMLTVYGIVDFFLILIVCLGLNLPLNNSLNKIRRKIWQNHRVLNRITSFGQIG